MARLDIKLTIVVLITIFKELFKEPTLIFDAKDVWFRDRETALNGNKYLSKFFRKAL